MFKFDFQVETDTETAETLFAKDENKNSVSTTNQDSQAKTEIECRQSERIVLAPDMLETLDIANLNSNEISLGEMKILYMITGLVLEDIKTNDKSLDISVAEDQEADLIPGIYEGGAKLWECTDDLLLYMSQTLDKEFFAGKRVLDLGCGAGLLGIYAFKLGSTVQFQDYNLDVLNKITIPNVLLNSSETNLANLNKMVTFYSGDWSDFIRKVEAEEDEKFDVILTSETIYNPENHQKLIDVFRHRLKSDGVIYLSAKTYYFGVGGGTRQFEQQLEKDKQFKSKNVWSSTDGVNREILEIKYIK